MVNWWLKNSTPKGQFANQITLEPLGFTLGTPVEGTGVLSNVTNIDVSGHSLGGHLATAFSRLFGGEGSIAHTYTYNSAGFTSSSEGFFSDIESLLDLGTSLERFPNNTEQSNFFAENGINVTTHNVFNGQKGERIALFNEMGHGIPNHYMYKLTDALALGNLIASLDSSFEIDDMNRLFAAASTSPEASLETILDSLGRLFIGADTSSTPIGDLSGNAPSREAYHNNLSYLKTVLFDSSGLTLTAKPQYQNITLIDLSTYEDPAQIATNAANNIEFRYALEKLDAFVLLNAEHVYQNHNVNGELALKHFSEQYIADRSQMLFWKLQQGLLDIGPSEYPTPEDLNSPIGFDGNATFTDITSGVEFNVDGNGIALPYSQIKFGSDQGESILGLDSDPVFQTGGEDRLYGGRGNDIVDGKSGDDYLEGNSGHDILIGGAGNDTMSGGEGNDTYYVDSILDVVEEKAGEGEADRIITSVDFTLSDSHKYIEQVVLDSRNGGSGAQLTGDQYNNRLVGNQLDNILLGGGGHDILSGGKGDDILFSGAGGDFTRIDYDNPNQEYNSTLIGGEGNDSYFISKGDSYEVIYDSDGLGGVYLAV